MFMLKKYENRWLLRKQVFENYHQKLAAKDCILSLVGKFLPQTGGRDTRWLSPGPVLPRPRAHEASRRLLRRCHMRQWGHKQRSCQLKGLDRSLSATPCLPQRAEGSLAGDTGRTVGDVPVRFYSLHGNAKKEGLTVKKINVFCKNLRHFIWAWRCG